MALLLFTQIPLKPCPPSSSSSSSSRLISTLTSSTFSRVHKKSVHLQTEVFNGRRPFWLKQRNGLILKASADVDDGAEPESSTPSSESDDEENIPIQNLPLESSLQLKLEKKMKMKVDKKVRLRRKKLLRKRALRKKGRWPPSKMKKNKNV